MKRILLSTLVLMVFFAVSAQAQIILNGSFEIPAIVANSTLQATPDSWLGDSQPVIVNGEISPGIPLPQDGQQFVSLGHFPGIPQAASLSQAFTISNPGIHILKWYDSTEFNFPNSSPYSVSVTDSLANIVASENFDADAQVLRLWTQRSITMTLAADIYTLRFSSNQAPSGEGSLIDNVSLVIPEPNSLLLGSLISIGLLMLSRQ